MDLEIVDWPIIVPAGSWNPKYIVLRNPLVTLPDGTKQPLDLTAPGYSARMVVATKADGTGLVLANLTDALVFRRTVEGRLYFEPLPSLTSTWTWRRGYHQVELTRPDATRPVRVAAGRIRVEPELVI